MPPTDRNFGRDGQRAGLHTSRDSLYRTARRERQRRSPWPHRSSIFARDPNSDKAGPILDQYERVWEGAPLGADDYVISADEKG
jgi:hypothetical protein